MAIVIVLDSSYLPDLYVIKNMKNSGVLHCEKIGVIRYTIYP